MKLIRTKAGGGNDGKCNAIGATTGKRCTRDSVKSGLCKQHWKILQGVERQLSSYPGGLLDEIPPAPMTLKDESASRWRQYCEVLKSYNELRGVYLKEILNLIILEEMFDDVLEDVETEGKYNTYQSENGSGSNISGPLVALKNLEKMIQDKRKTYWLQPDMRRAKELAAADASSRKRESKPAMRSAKKF